MLRILRLQSALLALSLGAVLSSADGQGAKQCCGPADPAPAKGTVVAEVEKEIRSVFQDSRNHYWFGGNTQGAYRYDGKTLTQFTTKDGLSGTQVSGFQEDKAGHLFISTSGGLSKFDGRTFTTLSIPATVSPMSEWKLQPDDLWFGAGGNTGAVLRWDGKKFYRLAFPTTKRGDDHYRRIPRDKYPNARYSPYDPYIIYRDRQGNVWFGTADLGACRFDGKSFDWLYEDHLTNTPGGGSFGIRSIFEDKDGAFWICTTDQRFRMAPSTTPAGGTGEVVYRKEKGAGDHSKGMGPDYFMAIDQDGEGNLWMATYGDLWRFDGQRMTSYLPPPGVALRCMFRDRQGNLWFGTDKAGVLKFNGKTFERFKP